MNTKQKIESIIKKNRSSIFFSNMEQILDQNIGHFHEATEDDVNWFIFEYGDLYIRFRSVSENDNIIEFKSDTGFEEFSNHYWDSKLISTYLKDPLIQDNEIFFHNLPTTKKKKIIDRLFNGQVGYAAWYETTNEYLNKTHNEHLVDATINVPEDLEKFYRKLAGKHYEIYPLRNFGAFIEHEDNFILVDVFNGFSWLKFPKTLSGIKKISKEYFKRSKKLKRPKPIDFVNKMIRIHGIHGYNVDLKQMRSKKILWTKIESNSIMFGNLDESFKVHLNQNQGKIEFVESDILGINADILEEIRIQKFTEINTIERDFRDDYKFNIYVVNIRTTSRDFNIVLDLKERLQINDFFKTLTGTKVSKIIL